MDSLDTKTLDEKGLNAAASYLESNGYEILERSYRCKHGKIDIIAKDEIGTVCFIDVETRSGISAGLPDDNIDLKKQAKFEKIAMFYMANKPNVDGLSIRFDTVAICASQNNHALLRHHKACFDGRGPVASNPSDKEIIDELQNKIKDLENQLSELKKAA